MPAVPVYATAVEPGVWRVQVRVIPGARKSQVDGLYDDRLKIRLQAPAVENKANKALVLFAAKIFGVKKAHVKLERGEKSRNKTLLVDFGSSPSWPV